MSLQRKASISGLITRVSFIALLLFYTLRFLWLAPSS